MYLYKGFSLVIASEIEFPELVPITNTEEAIDLTVTIGTTPTALVGNGVVKKVSNWTSPTAFLLHIIDVARYHLEGNKVTIEPLSSSADWSSIRTFFLGSMVSAALHYRGILPIHASAVHYQDGLVLFCGLSGAGKSTTATFLDKRGYPIFSDDTCVIRPEHVSAQQVLAQASYPMCRLWTDTLDTLAEPSYTKAHRVRDGIEKYGNYFHTSFDERALPIKHIYQLTTRNNPDIAKEEVTSKVQRINILSRHTFRRRQLDGIGTKAAHFKLLSQLSHLPISNLYRPSSGTPISSFIDFIEHECLTGNTAKKA